MICANCGCEFDLDEVMETEFELGGDIWEYEEFIDMSEPICEECAYVFLGTII